MLALAAVVAAGCGGDSDPSGAAADETTSTAEAETFDTRPPLDDSPFCVSVRALEALSSTPASGDASSADVLAQNAQMRTLVDDATATAPPDAPAEVGALFEDYRALSSAIDAAGGDTAAAYSALNGDAPELLARLSRPDAHVGAFRFFADRCGTSPP